MTWELAIVLLLLTATIVMFMLNRPRMDAVALIMMTLLPLTGVISVSDALSGLSDPNIVLIGALFVIGEGLCVQASPSGLAMLWCGVRAAVKRG